jgi:hypothetical protein
MHKRRFCGALAAGRTAKYFITCRVCSFAMRKKATRSAEGTRPYSNNLTTNFQNQSRERERIYNAQRVLCTALFHSLSVNFDSWVNSGNKSGGCSQGRVTWRVYFAVPCVGANGDTKTAACSSLPAKRASLSLSIVARATLGFRCPVLSIT